MVETSSKSYLHQGSAVVSPNLAEQSVRRSSLALFCRDVTEQFSSGVWSELRHSTFTWRKLVTPYSLNYHSLQLLLCIARADNHTSVPRSLLLSTSPAGWRTRPLTSPLIRRLMALWRETLAIGWSRRSTTWWRCAPWCLCSFSPASTPSYTRGIHPVAYWHVHTKGKKHSPCRFARLHRQEAVSEDLRPLRAHIYCAARLLASVPLLYFPALSAHCPVYLSVTPPPPPL